MFVKVVACSASILFALSIPADALLGGGGGSKSRGGGSKASSSSKSSSKSSSRSRGGISAGVSAGRGGISAGASVGGARAGASVGGRSGVSAGASAGGIGAGASVSSSGARVGASAGSLSTSANVSGGGVNATVSGTSGSLSATVGASGIGISAAPANNGAPQAAQQQQAFAAASVNIADLLPWELRPVAAAACDTASTCEMFTGRSALIASTTQNTLDSDGNIPTPIVSACQRAAAEAAQTFGALKVEAASAGRVKRAENGGVVAPVSVRITYGLANGSTQVRQAEVECAVTGGGQVVALR